MIDEIFTPPDLANDLVELATAHGRELGIVADFAAGDGALLRAAAQTQPNLQVVGLDISRTTVRKLRAVTPFWQIGACDFLNPRSRASSPILRRNRGRVSTVLLNPPFSCRGARREQVSLGGERLTCSVAMAFILTAVKYLSPNGQIVAVAPRGMEKAERDEAAWDLLRSMGTVEILGYPDRGAFPGRLSVRYCLDSHSDRQPSDGGPHGLQWQPSTNARRSRLCAGPFRCIAHIPAMQACHSSTLPTSRTGNCAPSAAGRACRVGVVEAQLSWCLESADRSYRKWFNSTCEVKSRCPIA